MFVLRFLVILFIVITQIACKISGKNEEGLLLNSRGHSTNYVSPADLKKLSGNLSDALSAVSLREEDGKDVPTEERKSVDTFLREAKKIASESPELLLKDEGLCRRILDRTNHIVSGKKKEGSAQEQQALRTGLLLTGLGAVGILSTAGVLASKKPSKPASFLPFLPLELAVLLL